MNLNNFQDKAIVEGEILRPELTGKDELKRSIQKETAVSSILLCKGEVYFYQHPFSRDGYGEIFIPSCSTFLKCKSHGQSEKIVQHFLVSNALLSRRRRSACMNENYFAKPGFQTLAQARHKFPLEMSGYKKSGEEIMSDIYDIQKRASLQVMELGLIGMIVNGVIDDKEDLDLWLELAKEHLLENFEEFYERIMETMEEM